MKIYTLAGLAAMAWEASVNMAFKDCCPLAPSCVLILALSPLSLHTTLTALQDELTLLEMPAPSNQWCQEHTIGVTIQKNRAE